jgi:hypothetical protein
VALLLNCDPARDHGQMLVGLASLWRRKVAVAASMPIAESASRAARRWVFHRATG